MPLGIAGSDRKLLIGGSILFVAMLAASVALSPPDDQTTSSIPSTYSTQSAGAEAAYLLLSRLHYPVRRWQDAPTELPPSDESNILLILAEPEQMPSKSERDAVLNFVSEGGHVLFTGSKLASFFPDANISWLSPDPKWASFSPNLPSRLASNASHITIQPQGYWGDLTEAQLALYGDADSKAVVSWSYGDGEILWWTGSTPLTNAGITQDDNLAFFLNSVSNWSNDRSYTIYWDEYFHGQRNSLWSYAGKPSITWGLVQIGLVAFVVLFTFGRRSGPIYRQQVVSRLSPLEYVDTLGGLYERAGAAPAAVSVSYQRLRYVLARQLGLPSDVPDNDLARLAAERLGWKDFQSKNVLGRADQASRALKIKTPEALGLVQELESYAERLAVRPKSRQEKI
jgi:hypothetical protein